VHDVRVVKSIPELDGAAMACMRQWKFKPAKDEHGQPVTVWVGVPIKFTLH
jgi:TonB family protein